MTKRNTGMGRKEKRKHRPSELNPSSLRVGNRQFFLAIREGRQKKRFTSHYITSGVLKKNFFYFLISVIIFLKFFLHFLKNNCF